jgi:DNA primase
VAQTFIAVSPDNMDPCELRLARGDAAVRDLIARREPLIAFALRSTIARFDLDTAEGRVGALRSTAPLVAKIKDRALRPEYARKLAGDLGMEVEPVTRAVLAATNRPASGPGPADPPAPAPRAPADTTNPRWLVEREALKLALQEPVLAGPSFDAVDSTFYLDPVHVAVRQAVDEAGGAVGTVGGVNWVEAVRDACADLASKAVVGELAVEPLRVNGDVDPRYVTVTLARLQLHAINRRIAELKSKLQRINPVTNQDEHLQRFGELVSLEQHARALREQTVGGL